MAQPRPQRQPWMDDVLDLATQEATGRFLILSPTGDRNWLWIRDGQLTGVSAPIRRPLLARRLVAFRLMGSRMVAKALESARDQPGTRLLDVLLAEEAVPEDFIVEYVRSTMCEQMASLQEAGVREVTFEPGRTQRISPMLLDVHDIVNAALTTEYLIPRDIAALAPVAHPGVKAGTPVEESFLLVSDGHRRPLGIADHLGLTIDETLRLLERMEELGAISLADPRSLPADDEDLTLPPITGLEPPAAAATAAPAAPPNRYRVPGPTKRGMGSPLSRPPVSARGSSPPRHRKPSPTVPPPTQGDPVTPAAPIPMPVGPSTIPAAAPTTTPIPGTAVPAGQYSAAYRAAEKAAAEKAAANKAAAEKAAADKAAAEKAAAEKAAAEKAAAEKAAAEKAAAEKEQSRKKSKKGKKSGAGKAAASDSGDGDGSRDSGPAPATEQASDSGGAGAPTSPEAIPQLAPPEVETPYAPPPWRVMPPPAVPTQPSRLPQPGDPGQGAAATAPAGRGYPVAGYPPASYPTAGYPGAGYPAASPGYVPEPAPAPRRSRAPAAPGELARLAAELQPTLPRPADQPEGSTVPHHHIPAPAPGFRHDAMSLLASFNTPGEATPRPAAAPAPPRQTPTPSPTRRGPVWEPVRPGDPAMKADLLSEMSLLTSSTDPDEATPQPAAAPAPPRQTPTPSPTRRGPVWEPVRPGDPAMKADLLSELHSLDDADPDSPEKPGQRPTDGPAKPKKKRLFGR